MSSEVKRTLGRAIHVLHVLHVLQDELVCLEVVEDFVKRSQLPS
jgi:hypothetical protein